MHLYLDTSTPDCVVKLSFAENRPDFSMDTPEIETFSAPLGRDMAEKLHAYLKSIFEQHGKTWHDLTSITYFSGPGSFTGLRIGATVVNTLADQLDIPLYNHHGEHVPLILPDYGRPANITPPKK